MIFLAIKCIINILLEGKDEIIIFEWKGSSSTSRIKIKKIHIFIFYGSGCILFGL